MSESKNPKGDNANSGKSNPAKSASKSKKAKASAEKTEVKKELSNETLEKTQEEVTAQPATANARTVVSIEALEEIREQQRLWRYGTYVGGLIFLILVLVVVSQRPKFRRCSSVRPSM